MRDDGGIAIRHLSSSDILLLLGNSNLFRIRRVQHHRDEAGFHLARVSRHAVQAAGRFVECLPRLEHLGRLVVDPQFVLAFHHVPDRRPGMAVRDAGLPGLDRHFHDRGRRLLAVQLLLEIGGREDLNLLAVLVVVRRVHRASTDTNTSRKREQCPNHGRFLQSVVRFTACDAVRRIRLTIL